MEGILPLLLWGGLLFLMMRFGCGSHMFGHGQGHGQKHDHSGHDHSSPAEKPSRQTADVVWTALEKDTDPVCGKEVNPETAKSSVHGGWVYYFCSRECREAFETAPETYLDAQSGGALPVPRLGHQQREGRSHA